MTLLAYHGQVERKTFYLHRVAVHRRADHITQGIGWEPGNGKPARGCAVGCTLENYSHDRYPIELGVPLILAHLEDRIFEGLPREEALDWPGWFLKVIPVGADLSRVAPRFLGRMLARRREAVEAMADLDSDVRSQVVTAIRQTEQVMEEWTATGIFPESAAWAARSAAACAACAAESAARSAAWAAWAACAAESAARSAEWSAAWSAGSAAKHDEYRWMGQVLLEELSRAPVVGEPEKP